MVHKDISIPLQSQISKGQIKKIKTLQGMIGLDDDTYRTMLMNVGGVSSCTQLKGKYIARVMRHMEAVAGHTREMSRGQPACQAGRGGQGERKKKYDDLGQRAGMATPKMLRFIEVIWAEVSRAPDKQKALRQFLQNRFGVSDIRFLDMQTGGNVIEALKGMGVRLKADRLKAEG